MYFLISGLPIYKYWLPGKYPRYSQWTKWKVVDHRNEECMVEGEMHGCCPSFWFTAFQITLHGNKRRWWWACSEYTRYSQIEQDHKKYPTVEGCLSTPNKVTRSFPSLSWSFELYTLLNSFWKEENWSKIISLKRSIVILFFSSFDFGPERCIDNREKRNKILEEITIWLISC